ncbi:MAG TPA: hypothetical protein HA362_04555 [Nanoarchaeota archaeon]|nr:hypothetical protein [Nanoarchaeota archaeon]
MRKLLLFAFAALLVFALPASATVLETSLAVRDKLPAETLADIPGFISRMETVGSKVSVDPVNGYYTAYNEDDLKAIFGDDAVLVPSPPGLLTITYKRGGTYKFWGMLHGLVVADSARKVITVTKGGFISSEDLNVNIAGDEIRIDADNPASVLFKIPSKGIYSQNNYFMGCLLKQEATEEGCMAWLCEQEPYFRECAQENPLFEPIEGCDANQMQRYRNYLQNEIDCRTSALVKPQEAYANLTGHGFLSENAFIADYKTKEPESFLSKAMEADANFAFVSDLYNVNMKRSRRLGFTASAPTGGSIDSKGIKSDELFKYSVGEHGEKAISGDRLAVYRPRGIILKAEDIENTPHFDPIVRIFEGSINDEQAFEIMQIKIGAVFFTPSSTGLYTQCTENKPPYEGISCFLSEESGLNYKLKINKPAAHEQPIMEINTDAISFNPDNPFERKQTYIEIEPFDINDDLSIVRLVNNADAEIVFTGKDIRIPPVGNDWAELGVSFKASIYPLSLPPQCDPGIFIGEECAIPKPVEVYDTIECKLPERKCYLNGVEVTGFIGGSVQRTKFCHEDSDCYNNQKCIEGMCVMKATCSALSLSSADSGFPAITTGPNKADVLFACDGYPSESACIDDVKKAIDKDSRYNGIFSVEPFKSNLQRFTFHTAAGSAAPSSRNWMRDFSVSRSLSDPSYGLTYTIRYSNSFVKQCPDSDYTIVLSKKEFRSFSEIEHFLSTSLRNVIFGTLGAGVYMSSADDNNFPQTALHEFGHLFGGLQDEYYEPVAGASGGIGNPNCISKEEILLHWSLWPDVLADALQGKWKGCGGPCESSKCASLLRPSENSVMNNEYTWLENRNEPGWKAFNEPSEAQIIEKLNEYS